MHPLFENTQSLTDAQLEEKILLLNRRYFQTNNPQLQEQIAALLDDYKLELQTRRVRQRLEQQEQNGDNGLDNLINIS